MEKQYWVLQHTVSNEEYRITKATFYAGRKETDITCKGTQVSRDHCMFIELSDGSLHVLDNQSLNGTFVNHVKIKPMELHQLHVNDEVGLGLHSNIADGFEQTYIFIVKKSNPIVTNDVEETTTIKFEDSKNKSNTSNGTLTSQQLLNVLISDDIDKPSRDFVVNNNRGQQDNIKVKHKFEKSYDVINPQPCCSRDIKQEPLNTEQNESDRNCGYTIEDNCIVISDDDDYFPCSQLLEDNNPTNNSNENCFSDSIFYTIKKELEELDRPEDGKVYAIVNLDDSDLEQNSNWFDDSEKQNGCDNPTANNNDIQEKETVPVQHKDAEQIPEASCISACENISSGKNKRKYVKPPIIQPHIELKNKRSKIIERLESIQEKPKSIEKENDRLKKIRTENFYDTKTNKDSSWKRKRKESAVTKETKEIIQEIRKKKLKEIASKSPEEKESKSLKSRIGTAKVKVSDSRGKYLTENLNMPSTSRVARSSIVKSNKSLKSDPRTAANKDSAISSKSTPYVPKAIIPLPSANVRQTASNNELPNICREIEDILIPVLNWNTLWFAERKDNKKCPPINKEPLIRMGQNFASYSDYYKTVKPLLLLELWNYIYKEFDSNEYDPRRKKFLAKIENVTKMSNYTELDCLTYLSKDQSDRIFHAKEEDVVILQFMFTRNDENVTIPFLGYVSNVRRKILQLADLIDRKFANSLRVLPHTLLTFKVLIRLFEGEVVFDSYMHIKIVTSFVSSSRVIKAIKYLERSLLCRHILKPTLADYLVSNITREKLFSQDSLNKTQYQAVMEATHICLRNEPGIYLIQGPPGTGKSTVIVNIIQQLVFRDLNSKSTKPRCILVVAPSNGAVDELALRLINLKPKMEAVYRKEIKLVRLGPKHMIHPNVLEYSLNEMARRNVNNTLLSERRTNTELWKLENKMAGLRNNCKTPQDDYELNALKNEFDKVVKRLMGKTYNEMFKTTEESLLSGARIICTTLSSCIVTRMETVFGRWSKKISCCIVDEATQSSEQETLIPLKLGIDKMVLVGDPKQLPAVTQSIEARNCAYGQSLFSRIMFHFEGSPNNPIRMLKEQYRMHPAICDFPSRKYYDGKLKTSIIVRNRKNQLSILKPYLLLSINTELPNTQEYQNKTEVSCVLKLLDAIVLNVNEAYNFTVGIITPYNNQKDAIRGEIGKKTFRTNVAITVNTVNSFQGQEKDVIIISYVRTNSNNFVSDEQRLNVAITRAKYALYIIGSENLLKTCPVLGKIYDDAKLRHLMKDVYTTTTTLTFSQLIKA